MTNHTEQRAKGLAGLGLGAVLILVGFLFLVVQLFNLDFAVTAYLWPFFIIVPGVLLFGVSLASHGEEGRRLAIVGSVVTMVGLLLFYQNTTEHWENWAYAWTLVAPGAVGIGQMLYGSLKHQPEITQQGVRLTLISAAMFAVGFFFFEVIIGLGGYGLARFGLVRFGWPVLLIGIGGLLIIYNLLNNRSSQPPQQGPLA